MFLQNTTKGTKKARTRNTCRVVHSDEESEEDSQEKDECKFKESSPKRKRTISITEDEDFEKDGTENYSKTSIRLTGVDKGSKKKGIQNDNHVSFLVHFHVLSQLLYTSLTGINVRRSK